MARTSEGLGAEIRDIRLPTLGEFGAVNRVILQSEAWAIHGIRRLSERTRRRAAGLAPTPPDGWRARRVPAITCSPRAGGST